MLFFFEMSKILAYSIVVYNVDLDIYIDIFTKVNFLEEFILISILIFFDNIGIYSCFFNRF